jgi:hypothetical protein
MLEGEVYGRRKPVAADREVVLFVSGRPSAHVFWSVSCDTHWLVPCGRIGAMVIFASFRHERYQISEREIITYEISSLGAWGDTNVATPRRFHRCPGRRGRGAFRPRVDRALSSGEVFVLGHEAR